MTPRARRRSALLRFPSLSALATVLLAGCALGERPTLTDDRLVDDAAIEAVLDVMRSADDATFTATYTVQPTLVGAPAVEATVRHTPNRTRVTFATDGAVTVEYSDTDGEQRTCAAGLTECVAGSDESRISNLAITRSFWGLSTEERLENDAARNTADATPTEPPAGVVPDLPLTCVAVPLGDVNAVYCALAAGPLAFYDGADVRIELTSYEPDVDPAAFG